MQECFSQTCLPRATASVSVASSVDVVTHVVVAVRRQADEDREEEGRAAVEDVAGRGFGKAFSHYASFPIRGNWGELIAGHSDPSPRRSLCAGAISAAIAGPDQVRRASGRSGPGESRDENHPRRHQTAPDRGCGAQVEVVEQDLSPLEGRKREQGGVAKQRAGHELGRRHGRDRKPDQRDQRRVETMQQSEACVTAPDK